MDFREYQNQYKNAHKTHDGQHTAHIIGVKEHQQLATNGDFLSNYRMQTAFTNQSVHTRIDNEFLDPGFDPITGTSYDGHYISPQTKVERLSRKIDAMKETGLIHNPTNMDYLRRNAERLDMDMRVFNNVSVRNDDLTVYRGHGRPRDSDYTGGGNLRRKK